MAKVVKKGLKDRERKVREAGGELRGMLDGGTFTRELLLIFIIPI